MRVAKNCTELYVQVYQNHQELGKLECLQATQARHEQLLALAGCIAVGIKMSVWPDGQNPKLT